jgi:two-component system chemotaxis sensor kinase CheA
MNFVPTKATPETSDKSDPDQLETPRPHQSRQSDSFKTVRIKTDTLDRLVNITGELITIRHRLADQFNAGHGSSFEEPMSQLTVLLRELRDEVFMARMLPVSLVTERFPRLTRDLARAQHKKIGLAIEDRKIELDRGILEDITEPLIHILRNAVDHGIELPAERAAAGKLPEGKITVSFVRDKDHVTITIADDGRGMDPAILAAKAADRGLINPAQAAALKPQEALLLICAPGFSTAETISDVSGRGVGMDAVKSAVHSLGGTLSIESVTGKGSSFHLRLPLTVSIIHALIVECANLSVAIPVNAVERTLELTHDDILAEEKRYFCLLDGNKVPLKSLHQILRQRKPKADSTYVPIVVSRFNDAPVGLVCDRISGQREIFVKPLGRPLSNLKNTTGGTIMGNGRIVFVMDSSTFS